jgi:hypothetical protein
MFIFSRKQYKIYIKRTSQMLGSTRIAAYGYSIFQGAFNLFSKKNSKSMVKNAGGGALLRKRKIMANNNCDSPLEKDIADIKRDIESLDKMIGVNQGMLKALTSGTKTSQLEPLKSMYWENLNATMQKFRRAMTKLLHNSELDERMIWGQGGELQNLNVIMHFGNMFHERISNDGLYEGVNRPTEDNMRRNIKSFEKIKEGAQELLAQKLAECEQQKQIEGGKKQVSGSSEKKKLLPPTNNALIATFKKTKVENKKPQVVYSKPKTNGRLTVPQPRLSNEALLVIKDKIVAIRQFLTIRFGNDTNAIRNYLSDPVNTVGFNAGKQAKMDGSKFDAKSYYLKLTPHAWAAVAVGFGVIPNTAAAKAKYVKDVSRGFGYGKPFFGNKTAGAKVLEWFKGEAKTQGGMIRNEIKSPVWKFAPVVIPGARGVYKFQF